MSVRETTTLAATPVPEDRRETFLPLLFGRQHFLIAELTVYGIMDRLSPRDYCGGLWTFYECAGQPLYLAPASKPRYQLQWHGNDYEGEVSADAAGIIATLFAFSHLSFQFPSEQLTDGYTRLYEYAAAHPEAAEIFRAID